MILYICDRKKCPECHSECEHTKDISHARNFFHTESDDGEVFYVELDEKDDGEVIYVVDEKEEEL